MTKKPPRRKFKKPSGPVEITGPVHVSYTSDYLGLHRLHTREGSEGRAMTLMMNAVEVVGVVLDGRRQREREKVSTAELMRRIREIDERAGSDE